MDYEIIYKADKFPLHISYFVGLLFIIGGIFIFIQVKNKVEGYKMGVAILVSLVGILLTVYQFSTYIYDYKNIWKPYQEDQVLVIEGYPNSLILEEQQMVLTHFI